MSFRRLAIVLGVAVAVLAAAPAGASASPPTPGTCAQDNPALDPDTEEVEWTCVYQPLTVGGYEVRQAAGGSVPHPSISADTHITHMDMDVADINGTPIQINRLMLHHIVFLNLARQDKTCANRGYAGFGEEDLTGGTQYAPERFAAAGEERMKLVFPEGFGYPLEQSDSWLMVYMLMNHKPTSDTAYITYHITTDPDPNISSARPYWLDVANCRADPIYNVAGAGRKARRKAAKSGQTLTSTRSSDFTIKEDGWIVAGAGHVHGGARKLTITKPSCNNAQIAESVPTWGLANHPFYNVRPVLHEPGPVGMSAFNTPTGIPVTEGQTIRLNSIYDNMRPHTRVMGIYVVYVAEDPPDAPSPQACGGAPNDTIYGPGTPLQGRAGPVPFRIPLTGLDENGNAVTIKGPPGPFKGMKSGATVFVGDRFFGRPNVRVRRGALLNYFFGSNELHNVTLANGPLGIGSPNLNANRSFSQRFTRAGTYRLFCALHPVQMSQRVIVKNKRKKHRRNRNR